MTSDVRPAHDSRIRICWLASFNAIKEIAKVIDYIGPSCWLAFAHDFDCLTVVCGMDFASVTCFDPAFFADKSNWASSVRLDPACALTERIFKKVDFQL